MIICDNWFHAVFIRQSSGRERKILVKSKNTVKRMFTLELHTTLCESVSDCVDYIFLLLCVVVYVIVSMCVCA